MVLIKCPNLISYNFKTTEWKKTDETQNEGWNLSPMFEQEPRCLLQSVAKEAIAMGRKTNFLHFCTKNPTKNDTKERY